MGFDSVTILQENQDCHFSDQERQGISRFLFGKCQFPLSKSNPHPNVSSPFVQALLSCHYYGKLWKEPNIEFLRMQRARKAAAMACYCSVRTTCKGSLLHSAPNKHDPQVFKLVETMKLTKSQKCALLAAKQTYEKTAEGLRSERQILTSRIRQVVKFASLFQEQDFIPHWISSRKAVQASWASINSWHASHSLNVLHESFLWSHQYILLASLSLCKLAYLFTQHCSENKGWQARVHATISLL